MRVLLYSLVALSALEQIWWLLTILGVFYIIYYSSYELFAIALLLDAYTGAFFAVPLYSLVSAPAIIVVEWLRPVVMHYTV